MGGTLCPGSRDGWLGKPVLGKQKDTIHAYIRPEIEGSSTDHVCQIYENQSSILRTKSRGRHHPSLIAYDRK